MIYSSRFIDTQIDTLKFTVPMTISIKLRNSPNRQGECPLYLHVSSRKQRKRLSLDLFIDKKYWHQTSESIKGPKELLNDKILILENIKSRITKIKTFYRLSNKHLTLENFVHEFQNEMPNANFINFFTAVLKDRKSTIKPSTYDKEMAVLNKLKNYRAVITFSEIDLQFFTEYRHYMANLGNNQKTRNGNVKIIKKYLRYAVNFGINLPVNLDEIKGGPTSGQKSYLNGKEVAKCFAFYTSGFISEGDKIAFGYFLFSCFTGLRFSDTMNLKRDKVLTGIFTIKHVKTGKLQTIQLNNSAKRIVAECPDLFIKKFTNNHVRAVVKKICAFLKIHKRVDYHMSRHTFGTNYILLGGQVTRLQQLLNHSDIKETMTYVHLAEQERNAESDLMDKLL